MKAPTLVLLGAAAALAAEAPYPPSPVIRKLVWESEVLRLGDGQDGRTGDNWPITWGDDDELYTSYGDGGGFRNPDRGLTLGFARVTGNPPWHRGEDIYSDADTPAGWGNKGIKTSGMLMVDGVLYLLTRNYVVGGDYRHSRLAWSSDRGRTWTWASWHFSGTFGCPDFVQFGPNYAGARDGFVYVVSQGNDDAYAFSPEIVMARVPKERLRDRAAWEFYAGAGPDRMPRWDHDIANRKPIFTDPRGTQRISLSYNHGLRRYILTSSHQAGEGPHNPSLGVFDAPEPWGPWTTVYYDDHWSGGDRTYHHKFPPKWMSADGRSMWLLFSGLGGGNYAFCLRQAVLDAATEAGGWMPLFDGRSLAGWRVAARPEDRAKTFWSVRDGLITCDSLGRKDHDYVWLITDGEYGDFELTLKARGYSHSPGNSGVQVRSRYDEAASWLDGPQVDLNPPGPWRSGLIYDETRETRRWIFPSLPDWKIEPAQGPKDWGWLQSGERGGWNRIHVVCQGTRITTRVNGYRIAELEGKGILDDEAHRRHRVGLRGHIALQLHTKDELFIQYKDIAWRAIGPGTQPGNVTR